MEKPTATAAKTSTPKLFCLVGLPGSGKTFFAEKFSDEYQIPFINLNKWRFLLTPQPTFDRAEDAKMTELAFDLLEQLFRTHKSILLEGNLYSRVDRQRYAQLARRYGYQPVVIWVQNADIEAKRRSIRLNAKAPKDFLIEPALFDELKRRFTPPNAAERPIAISGKHSFRMQYRSVLKRIAEIAQLPNQSQSGHDLAVAARSNAGQQAAPAKRRLRIFG